MSEFKNRNDYSVTFFMMNENVIKYEFVHNIASLANYVVQKYGYYHHFNIYARRTGRFLHQVKKTDKLYRSYHWLHKK